MGYFYDAFMVHFCPFWSMTVPRTLLFHSVEESSSDITVKYSFDDPRKKECHIRLKHHIAIRMKIDLGNYTVSSRSVISTLSCRFSKN